MSKGAICPSGHRSGAPIGSKCGAKLRHQALCQERVTSEPLVRTCQRCHRGIYVEGWCSFCGHMDPETREEAHVGQEEEQTSERGLVGAETGRQGHIGSPSPLICTQAQKDALSRMLEDR